MRVSGNERGTLDATSPLVFDDLSLSDMTVDPLREIGVSNFIRNCTERPEIDSDLLRHRTSAVLAPFARRYGHGGACARLRQLSFLQLQLETARYDESSETKARHGCERERKRKRANEKERAKSAGVSRQVDARVKKRGGGGGVGKGETERGKKGKQTRQSSTA